jgi:hypothetical protein
MAERNPLASIMGTKLLEGGKAYEGGEARSYTPKAYKEGDNVYSVKPGVTLEGKSHAVIDRRTNQIVGAYKVPARASSHVHRLDNEYGSYISHRLPISWLEPVDK